MRAEIVRGNKIIFCTYSLLVPWIPLRYVCAFVPAFVLGGYKVAKKVVFTQFVTSGPIAQAEIQVGAVNTWSG